MAKSKAQIIEELTALGIEHDANATVAELTTLLNKELDKTKSDAVATAEPSTQEPTPMENYLEAIKVLLEDAIAAGGNARYIGRDIAQSLQSRFTRGNYQNLIPSKVQDLKIGISRLDWAGAELANTNRQ